MAVGGLVVLRRVEPLGLEAEHDEQQGEPDGDEPLEGREPLLHGRYALVRPEHREERLLRDLDGTDPLHPLLAFLLLLEQLPLARDVATVALGEDVLAHRPHGFAGDDVRADRRLDRDLEHLAGDQLLEPLGQDPPDRLGLVAVDDEREGIDGLAVDEDVDLGEVRRPVAELLVVHRGVALAAALELVEVVDDELRERHLEMEDDPGRVEVLHVDERPAAVRRELHQRADVLARRDDAELDPGLLDLLDVGRVREERRVVDDDAAAAVRRARRGTRPTAPTR